METNDVPQRPVLTADETGHSIRRSDEQAVDSLSFTLRQLIRAAEETQAAVQYSMRHDMRTGDFLDAVDTFPQLRSYLRSTGSLLDRVEHAVHLINTIKPQ